METDSNPYGNLAETEAFKPEGQKSLISLDKWHQKGS